MQIRLRFEGDDPCSKVDIEFRALAAIRSNVKDETICANETIEKRSIIVIVVSARN